MAIYSLRMSIIGRGGGKNRSAVAASAYRSRSVLHDEKRDHTFNYANVKDIKGRGVELPENAPAEYRNREKLWNAVEAKEDTSTRRDTAQLARDVMVALPRELSTAQQVRLVRAFVQTEYVSRGMAADWAIHETPAADGQTNPHAHIMLTFREFNPEKPLGMGNKCREWNAYFRREADEKAQARGEEKGGTYIAADNGQVFLKDSRGTWARLVNEALEESGSSSRVDHRSYAAQGVEKTPGLHLGKAHHRAERGDLSSRYVQHRATQAMQRIQQHKITHGQPLAVTVGQRLQKRYDAERESMQRSPSSLVATVHAGREHLRSVGREPPPAHVTRERVRAVRSVPQHGTNQHKLAREFLRGKHDKEKDKDKERDDGAGHEL